jgi:DNA anti-recombination protein RmuC
LLAEGYDLLNRKIDRVEANLTEKINENAVQIGCVNQKIDRVETTLNQRIDHVEANLNQRIDRFEANLTKKIDEVAAELEAHRNDTESHRGYRVAER